WYSWQKANPYPLGINWASALEVAFRSLSWLWVRSLLAECPILSDTFHTDLLRSLQSHGQYIERYLSTYFSPNTHLLGEAVALFFIGTLCPEISTAEHWRHQGWKILIEESEKQIRPDGVYFEQALYYHVYALDFFLHARHLASANGFSVPEQFDQVLKKMLNVLDALSEVGPPEGFGDDDGGRVFNPRRNRIEDMTDPLALGMLLYDSENYTAASLTEEAVWLFGDWAIQKLGKPTLQREAPSKAFPSGGIYIINDREPCVQQLMIDAGPQGTRNSGHGHADALSIRFSIGARRFLVDPGTCCYISGTEDRDSFRDTAAHNTLRVDNLDQAVPEAPFAWSSLPNVTAETWLNGQTFDYFVGRHDGYRRLPDPVLHRRSVFHVKGSLWLVRDVAEGRGSHLLETFWHFAPELKVKEQDGIVLAESPITGSYAKSARLALLLDPNSAWRTEITAGFISPAYGSKQSAPVMRVSAEVELPEDCGVLLLPATLASEPGAFAAIGESASREVRGYRYQTLHSTEFLFFGQGGSPWTCNSWASDASLLYCKLGRGRITHI
ncbi:MAG: alginate lyase family protein, partial [Candidatus Sulfotelmatobacter sp.]